MTLNNQENMNLEVAMEELNESELEQVAGGVGLVLGLDLSPLAAVAIAVDVPVLTGVLGTVSGLLGTVTGLLGGLSLGGIAVPPISTPPVTTPPVEPV